jgi:hypothetical protein
VNVDRQAVGDYLAREFDQGEHARVDMIVRLASDAVAGFLGIASEQLASDPPPPAEGVIIAVAARAVENPLSLQSEGAGQWSASWAEGGFSLTRSERRQLQPYRASTGAVASEITLQSPHRQNVPWVGAGVGGNRVFNDQEGERVPWIANS